MKNPWLYIVANCTVAVVGVLSAVAWPNLIGPQAAPYIVAALGVANTVAHSLAGPGPASGQS